MTNEGLRKNVGEILRDLDPGGEILRDLDHGT